MILRLVLLIGALTLGSVGCAHHGGMPGSRRSIPPKRAAAQVAAMGKLAFLAGRWEGKGWIARRGERHTFRGMERVRPRLGGLLLEIEGLHFDAKGGPRPVHHALAWISYDARHKRYRFQSHLLNGRYQGSQAEVVGERRIRWGFAMPGRGAVSFSIEVQGDRWTETGTIALGGKPPRPFFGMTMRRVGR